MAGQWSPTSSCGTAAVESVQLPQLERGAEPKERSVGRLNRGIADRRW